MSPVYVETVEPLKTGAGLLRLSLIAGLELPRPRRLSVDVTVVGHTAEYICATYLLPAGRKATVLIEPMSWEWLRRCVPSLLERRPLAFVSPYDADVTSAQYLSLALGHSPDQILCGATAESFRCDKPVMPDQHTTLKLDWTLEGLDVFLCLRGHVPMEMEDKWFIYAQGDHLLFRRSWTGYLIYDLLTRQNGDRLHLLDARVNRDPQQYTEESVAEDRRQLRTLISNRLVGRPLAC